MNIFMKFIYIQCISRCFSQCEYVQAYVDTEAADCALVKSTLLFFAVISTFQ